MFDVGDLAQLLVVVGVDEVGVVGQPTDAKDCHYPDEHFHYLCVMREVQGSGWVTDSSQLC